jgi:hypothetical protein
MKFKNNMKATGTLHIVVRDQDDNVIQDVITTNLVVDSGLDYIAERMKDTGQPNEMSHMAIGTDATAAAAGDTALGAEVGRVALATAGGTVTSNAVEYVATFPAGTGTGSIVEAGVLNAGTGGDLLCRSDFGIVTKGASDSMSITWTVTVS